MKQTVVVPQLNLPYRDEQVVDKVIGKKRKSVKDCENVDFSKCGLAQAYPTLEDYFEEIYKQRNEQKSGGRLASPRAMAPVYMPKKALPRDPPPWEDGPSAADVHKAYKTTDRGR